MRTLQEFASVHASVSNQRQERSPSSPDIFKVNRTSALAEGRGLCVD
jgi:hypothetical protein